MEIVREVTFVWMPNENHQAIQTVINPYFDNEKDLENFSYGMDAIGDQIFKDGFSFVRIAYNELENGEKSPRKLVLPRVVAIKASIPTFIREETRIEQEFKAKQANAN